MRLSSHEGGGGWPGGVNGIPPGLFGRTSMFGDGSYSGNVIQGGSVLQPQAIYTANLGKVSGTAFATYTTNFGSALTTLNDGSLTPGPALRPTLGCNMGIDCGVGVSKSINSFSLSQSVYSERYCTSVKLQYSPDGSTWYDSQTFSTTNLGTTTLVTYVLATPVTGRAFRLVAMVSNANNYWEVNEIQFNEYVTFQNSIVITGAATVVPDAATGAAVFSCQSLVLDGASASLLPSSSCKGLIGYIAGNVTLLNGATISMTRKGVAGAVAADVPVYDLAPLSMRRKLSRVKLAAYLLKAVGAVGAAAMVAAGNGNTGIAGAAWQSGGGGSGSSFNSGTSGAGAAGTCFCGGAGGGGITNSGTVTPGANGKNAKPDGGPGGDGYTDAGDWCAGGAGVPPGWGSGGGTVHSPAQDGNDGAGGLLLLFAFSYSITSGCVIQSDGAVGGSSAHNCGGSSGGGIVGLIYRDTYINLGTVRANGGAAAVGGNIGGPGGSGSVNIAQAA